MTSLKKEACFCQLLSEIQVLLFPRVELHLSEFHCHEQQCRMAYAALVVGVSTQSHSPLM